MVFIHGAGLPGACGSASSASAASAPVPIASPAASAHCALNQAWAARSARWHRDLLDLVLPRGDPCHCQHVGLPVGSVERGADACMWTPSPPVAALGALGALGALSARLE